MSTDNDDAQAEALGELRVETENLYREELYTDLRVATIRRLVPVRPDGAPDDSRETLYSGQTTLMSQAGPIPVECPIEAKTLSEAAQKFPEAVKEAVDRLMEEAREIRRREASRIVVPGVPGVGGNVPPGRGFPGGGGGAGGGIIGG